MMIYDKDGKRIKAFTADGHEIGVMSVLDADAQWREQYEQTILVEKTAIIEALAIVGLIAALIVKEIKNDYLQN